MAYIVWSPDKVILDLVFVALRWYSLLFAMGFVLSYLLLKGRFRKEGLSEQVLGKPAQYAVLGTVIGARLGHCLFYDFGYCGSSRTSSLSVMPVWQVTVGRSTS